MRAVKQAIQKLKTMGSLPASLQSMLDEALRKDEQHQGEPVAYLCKAEGAKWLQYHSKVGDPWKPGEVELAPLYTHADPAYVEQGYSHEVVQRMQAKIDDQRAQLAERDALLRDTKVMLASELSYELFVKMASHIKRIEAALSASAEQKQKTPN